MLELGHDRLTLAQFLVIWLVFFVAFGILKWVWSRAAAKRMASACVSYRNGYIDGLKCALAVARTAECTIDEIQREIGDCYQERGLHRDGSEKKT